MRKGRRGLSSKKAHSRDVWLIVLKEYLVCLESDREISTKLQAKTSPWTREQWGKATSINRQET